MIIQTSYNKCKLYFYEKGYYQWTVAQDSLPAEAHFRIISGNPRQFNYRDESANCAYLQELVQEIAEDKGFTVHLFECGEGDHVHCSFGKGSCGTIPIMWNGRICIGRKHPQVHRTSEQSVLILWRRGNTAVKENIHKGQPGICEPHRAYVRCSIQALECL